MIRSYLRYTTLALGCTLEVHRAGRFIGTAGRFERDGAGENNLTRRRHRGYDGSAAIGARGEERGANWSALRADPPEFVGFIWRRGRQPGDLKQGLSARGADRDKAGGVGCGRQRPELDRTQIGREHRMDHLAVGRGFLTEADQLAIAGDELFAQAA